MRQAGARTDRKRNVQRGKCRSNDFGELGMGHSGAEIAHAELDCVKRYQRIPVGHVGENCSSSAIFYRARRDELLVAGLTIKSNLPVIAQSACCLEVHCKTLTCCEGEHSAEEPRSLVGARLDRDRCL